MASESEWETAELKTQLNAFAAAQLLREELAAAKVKVTALEKTLAENLDTITKLSDELEALRTNERPLLDCPNCDNQLAPADHFEDGVWSWELSKAYECSECGTKSRVAEAGGITSLDVIEDEDEWPSEDNGDAEESEDW